jgi:hypothetical protein
MCVIMAASALLGACDDPAAGPLEEVLDAYDDLAARSSWPGFEAREIPLALFDDERTYLYRHPTPPDEFQTLRGLDGVLVLDSVHPAMRANTSIELAGALTATVRVSPEQMETPAELARLLVHEAFHVFQNERHPEWTANEVDLFVYPVHRVSLLQQRRLETGALRRALTAPDSVRTVCWSNAFLRIRDDRFGRLPQEAVAYERGTELREGLARYVEATAVGDPNPSLPADGFLPEDVRQRSYATGHALGRLLDLLDRDWKQRLEQGEVESLDGAIRAATAGLDVRRCGPSPDEVRRARAVARSDSADLVRRNETARRGFEDALGWRIVVDAPEASPLFPGGFDPLNVRVLDRTHVLHGRWLQLSNDSVTIEVLDRPSLTAGVGPHPLFNGVQRLTVTGLRTEPTVAEGEDMLTITAEGVDVTARGAVLVREERVLRLELGS